MWWEGSLNAISRVENENHKLCEIINTQAKIKKAFNKQEAVNS